MILLNLNRAILLLSLTITKRLKSVIAYPALGPNIQSELSHVLIDCLPNPEIGSVEAIETVVLYNAVERSLGQSAWNVLMSWSEYVVNTESLERTRQFELMMKVMRVSNTPKDSFSQEVMAFISKFLTKREWMDTNLKEASRHPFNEMDQRVLCRSESSEASILEHMELIAKLNCIASAYLECVRTFGLGPIQSEIEQTFDLDCKDLISSQLASFISTYDHR